MAGGFDDAFIAEVRTRNDLVSVVSDYVTLRKAGTSHKGLCPFHGEKTPSFTVHGDRQYFYCFGCQAGGDVIKFVKEINGFSFPEAVRHLANRAGIAVPEPEAGSYRGRSQEGRETRKEARENFFHVNRLAMRFYVETLGGEHGLRCRSYLRERGVDAQWSARFELGCAPDRWDGLVQYLQREGADLQAAETLGLIVRKSDGRGAYDRFRNRLMFPIRNLAAEVIGFSGRDLGESTLMAAVGRNGEAPQAPAKYVNSPESPIYTKGDQLYGLYEARQALRKTQTAVLVEGNLDLVRLHQAGIEHTVAPLGTALTGTQLRAIKRFVPRVIAFYDGDGAGREAAKKAVHLSLAEGVLIEVARLPEGADPDSHFRHHGVTGLQSVLDAAIPGWEYLIDAVLAETRGTQSIQGARSTVERLAPVLADIEDRDMRSMLEARLASVLGIDPGRVRDITQSQVRRRSPDNSTRTPGNGTGGGPVAPPRTSPPSGPIPEREFKLLVLLLTSPDVRPVFVGRDGAALVHHPDIRQAISRALEHHGDLPSWLAALPPGDMRNQIFTRLSQAVMPAPGQALPELDMLMRGLRIEAIGRRVEALQAEERRASLTRDENRMMTLMTERLQLQRQLDELRSIRG